MLKKILFFKSVYAIMNRHFSNLVIHFFLKLTYTITFFWIITTTNISNKFMIIKNFFHKLLNNHPTDTYCTRQSDENLNLPDTCLYANYF